MTTAADNIDQTIRTLAARRLGVADVSIVRSESWQSDEYGGVWFLLSVKLPGDVAWQPLGRRRTKAELLELVGTLDPQHLNGKHFFSTTGVPNR